MKELAILLILLASLLFISGCVEKAKENSLNYNNPQNNDSNSNSSQNLKNKSIVLEASNLKLVNMSLQKSPVLLEFSAAGCSDCKKMKPILAQIAAEYENEVTVISVNLSKYPKLANNFGVRAVPVSFVIMGIDNGNYSYMLEDGNVSMNVSQAKIDGLQKKEVFEKILDTALQQRKTSVKANLTRST